MQTFDVVILGAGQTGTHIARQLSQNKLNIALVALPFQTEDYLQQLVAALSNGQMPTTPTTPIENVTQISATTAPKFLGERRMSINSDEFQFKSAVLATGCRSKQLTTHPKVITPIQAFQSDQRPSSFAVWGAGPSGISTAMKLVASGNSVQLISKYDRVLPGEDEATSAFAAEQLKKANVEILRNDLASNVECTHVSCVGLAPNSNELNLSAAFIYTDTDGRVKTDEQMRTSNPYVYAVGAITGPPFHLNFERFQADLVIENIPAPFFMKHRFMPEAFPSVIPFSPALARIGLTESDARKKFKDVVTVTETVENGFVKLVALKRSGSLVGAHLGGNGADLLVLFFDLLMRAEIPLRDVLERHHFPSSALSDATATAVERWIELAGR